MGNKWFNCCGEWLMVVPCSSNSQQFSANGRINYTRWYSTWLVWYSGNRKSKWISFIKGTKIIYIYIYIYLNDLDLEWIKTYSKNSLSKMQQSELSKLINDRALVIKPADKKGWVCSSNCFHNTYFNLNLNL